MVTVSATSPLHEQSKGDGGISPAETEATACVHCGLPVPPASRDREFCCAGCRTVHGLLLGAGLERFYDLGGGKGQPIGREPQPAARDWLPEWIERGRIGTTQVRLDLDVQGVHCAACVWLLDALWRRRPGALRADINPSLGTLTLHYDATALDVTDYLDSIEALGYRVGPRRKQSAAQDRSLLVRLGVCAALALNAMMFAFAGYFGLVADGDAVGRLFHWLAFGFATAAVAVGGTVFFRAALAGLRRRVMHLDLPISLGILLAYTGSAYQFFLGSGAGYFDTVTVFVALMLTGRYLQRRALQRNRDYLLDHSGAEHLRARRVVRTAEGTERLELTPITELRAGATLRLCPGDLVPTACTLLDAASFSLDWIRGEAEPVEFAAGATVPAGAFLRSSHTTRLRVDEDATESELLHLLATPAGDRDDRVRSKFWTRLNRGYVWAVLALAAAAATLWTIVDPSRALDVVVAVLVVTCPCALGLATPLAFDLALARLRARGIYVRMTSLLERARRVRKVVFDKTGTLTWGELTAEPMRPIPDDCAAVLWTMASSSNHPVSRAIAASLRDRGLELVPDLVVTEVPGRGVHARHDGRDYYLGAQSFVFHETPAQHEGRHCLFTRDGHVETCFRIGEHVREGFATEVAQLQA